MSCSQIVNSMPFVDQIARCRPVSAIISLDNLKQFRYLVWGFYHKNLNVDLSCRQIQEDIICLDVYVFFHNCRSFGLASVFFSWPKPSGFRSGQPLRPFWVRSGENKIFIHQNNAILAFQDRRSTLCIFDCINELEWSIDYNLLSNHSTA